MSVTIEDIELLLKQAKTEEAIEAAQKFIAESTTPCDRAYYLLGNAYRKKGDWQGAINNYLEAIAINPASPAKQAYQMANDILEFYNKDMYNQ